LCSSPFFSRAGGVCGNWLVAWLNETIGHGK
jgi:hypothetical protein